MSFIKPIDSVAVEGGYASLHELPSRLRSNVETPPEGYPLSLAGNRPYDGSEFWALRQGVKAKHEFVRNRVTKYGRTWKT